MKILDRAARRILDRLQLAVRPGATATRQGGHRSPVLASGVEFADHRAYVPGDDVRHIDWKAFARHGQLTLRQFEEERDWVKFHSPKNLASALSVEAAELLEHFQWLTEGESAWLNTYHAKVREKIGPQVDGETSAWLDRATRAI